MAIRACRCAVAVWTVLVAGCPTGNGGDTADDPLQRVDVDAFYEGVEACSPTEDGDVPQRSSYGDWQMIELPDTYCSDGSQYRFFVSYSSTRNDLAILFEPGGACWDYESCSGRGARGAANPAGIPEDHMDTWGIAYPVWSDFDIGDGPGGESLTFMRDWNRVFLPYCTGDVFIGSVEREYRGDDGEQLTYRHMGQHNMQRIIPWLDDTFTDVPRMLVGGCSAGGIGALLNYHQLRRGITGAQCGYLVNDSGPLFGSDGPSAPLHAMIRSAWNTDDAFAAYGELAEAVLGEGGSAALEDDVGALNALLALGYPSDRLSTVLYRWDFNYSLYSYDTFYGMPPDSEIFDMWGRDVETMVEQYDRYPNLAYYLPHARPDNCSHCLTIAPLDHVAEALAGMPYLGTEIEQAGVNLHDFYVHLLDDDAPLSSYRETEPPAGEGLTDEQTASCR